MARIALNALMLGIEALPGGGALSLASDGNGDGDGLMLCIAGRRAAWPEGLIELLEQPLQARTALREFGPRRLQAPLLVMLAEVTAIRLRLLPGQPAAKLHIQATAASA